MASSIERDLSSVKLSFRGPVKLWRDVGWKKPLSTDGAIKGNLGMGGANGLLRDVQGRLIGWLCTVRGHHFICSY